MLINELQKKLLGAPSLTPLVRKLDGGEDTDLGVVASVRPFVVASVYARAPRPMLVVVSGAEAAERFAHGVASFLGRERVLVFPERTDRPWVEEWPDLAQVGARVRAMGSLSLGRPVVVVASARALLRRVAPSGGRLFSPLTITREEGCVDVETGETLSYEEFPKRLISRGYKHLEALDGPGTFCVHGDTVDVFGAGMTAPVRIEFFGDDVDGLRRVVASTGQSIAELEFVEIWPAREYSISKTGLDRMRRELTARIATDQLVANHMTMFEQGIDFAGMDRYVPYLYRQLESPVAHAHPDTLVVAAEPRSLIDDAARRYDEISAMSSEAGVRRETLSLLYSPPAKLDLGSQQRLTLLSIMRAGGVTDADIAIKRPEISGREERLISTLRSLIGGKTTTLFSVPDHRVRESMELMLVDNSIPFVEAFDADDKKLSEEFVNVTDVDIPSGFIIPDAGIAFISIGDLSRRKGAIHAQKTVDITEVTFPYKPGDYVVHVKHGIALFKEIIRQEVGGVERDYLLLEYAGGDRLYVPVEQIDRVTRYVGPEGVNPRPTRLGSADWTRAINKARKSAKKLAFDLVDLYARRSTVKGFTYSVDGEWQEEMERIFPYTETPDQLAAIADVKADMESDRPMDRLICGDVGFGKTEVALRAAFKAVSDHRQVMILCPTTILAQQHFSTFQDRFEPFGMHVEVLSRFRTGAQQRNALEGFAKGTVDVLVGTHRLLSRDVNPLNLGLIIIDEEQRFGVQHKEQLKNMRESVDVLTLSATPIPRTLQMSLSGVRDMSLITTPPPNRRPIEVHVGEWDEDIVSGAIRREMERGGQTYYVSNRVRTIDDAVDRVVSAAPEARVGVAHGQMSPAQVEEVMEQFSAGEIDVLVATTIVESGIDNPHTNTLIIEDSQRLGLAQLYQLKGRVGRSIRQAYAYFLFPGDQRLTEEATDRLQAIGELTDLGSGMKLAMRDLEIRGAGTLLGAEQSGNLSAVGFDLFASMLAEAVGEARGEDAIAHPDIHVEVSCDYHIPEEYMPAADERVMFYRRIAAAVSSDEINQIADEIRAAHGVLPEPAANMIDRARIKALASECGVTNVAQIGGKLVIEPVSTTLSVLVGKDEAAHRVLIAKRALYVQRGHKYHVPLPVGESIQALAAEVLEELARVARDQR